jgi:ABC-2 type transport system ATP-binding protein
MLTIKINQKKYSDKLVLENVALSIPENGIYGMVGKNGEGKTTLFKCVLGFETYTGESTFKNNKIVLQDVGWCPAEPKLYGELTAYEFYDFYRLLLELKEVEGKKLFDVPENKLIREFSTGMKKKTYLNAIFQKEYPIYFLDEPFNGLDLESNHVLMQYLKHKAKDCVIVISSHIMDVLYNNCAKIFVVHNKNVTEFEKETFNEIENVLFNY